MSAPLTHCAICARRVFGARLINFLRTWGEQRTPGAWKGHPAYPVLFVFAQKTDKFQFTANGMNHLRMAQRRFAVPSTHMRIWFANHSPHLCMRGYRIHSLRRNCDRWRYKSIRGEWAPVLGQPLQIFTFRLQNIHSKFEVKEHTIWWTG